MRFSTILDAFRPGFDYHDVNVLRVEAGRPQEHVMRVVCISAECEPWAKTGGLGDVVDALTRAVGARGPGGQAIEAGIPHIVQSQVWVGTGAVMGVGDSAFAGHVERPVDLFLPKYRGVEAPADAISRSLLVPDQLAESGVTEVTIVEFEARGYRVRFVDYPPAFDRAGYYGDENGDYPDNGWRFGLLCRAALEALLVDGRPVDVLHLHDWQAMPAVVLRDCAYEAYPLIARAAVMATIHNLAYQGWLTRDQAAGLAFPDELKRVMKPHADGILLLREGIDRAELVNTVSPGYAQEALTPAFGIGLDQALAGLGHRFGGILNGLDMTVWDPATDADLPANYSRSDMAGKAVCRRGLLTELGFDPNDDGPVLSMIGRLDPQKGFDLLAGAAPELVAAGARIVVLGSGDPKRIAGMREIATQHPESVAIVEAFDRALARRIYAGADLYLMPSRFEPCGQGQMISLRYGTPAVVRRTGGLADTIVDVREWPGEGTGFLFDTASPKSLATVCRRAMEHYRRGGEEWAALRDRGMAIDWSWEAGPAEQYAASYRRAVSLRGDT